jgi:hypothetical protein
MFTRFSDVAGRPKSQRNAVENVETWEASPVFLFEFSNKFYVPGYLTNLLRGLLAGF